MLNVTLREVRVLFQMLSFPVTPVFNLLQKRPFRERFGLAKNVVH